MANVKVNYLHLCDEANFSQEGKLNMLGIFDQINIETFPGGILKAKLILNATVSDWHEESLELQLTFTHAISNEGIIEPVKMNISKDSKNKNNQTFGVIIDLTQVSFKEPGTYHINIKTQSTMIGVLPVNVSKKETVG